jgi:gephyrin
MLYAVRLILDVVCTTLTYSSAASDPPGVYKVVTPRNHSLSTPLPDGFIYRINTGAPLPAGADTVIMVEDTRVVSTHDDGEEKEVETLLQVPPQQDVRTPGSDVQKGDLVLRRGDLISARGGEIGLLAFVGRKNVEVYQKPIVAILSTGNEITDIQSTNSGIGEDGWGGIWDTNRPSLQAALEGMGYQVLDLGIVQDK